MSRHKQQMVLAVGCLISVGAIWYATREVNWAEFGRAIRAFNMLWLLPALAAFYISMYLRAVRWGLLFRPHYRLGAAKTFAPLMIGFAFNSILPGRVGEVVRCLAVNRTGKTGVTKAFATVVAERILDGLVLLGFLAVSLWMVPIDPAATYQWNNLTLDAAMIDSGTRKLGLICGVLMAGVILVLIPAVQRLVKAIIQRMTFLSAGVRHKIDHLFNEFSLGFQALMQPWPMIQILVHSVVLWALVGVSNMMVAYGFDISMNFWQAMALVTLIGFAIVVPAAPGYWGLYEAGVIFSMLILAIEQNTSRSLAFGLMIHMLQWGPIVVIGLILAARAQVKVGTDVALPEEIVASAKGDGPAA